jgi:multidrug efflux pump subunit AcrB
MSPSRPFILRAVAISLLMVGILLVGAIVYDQVPVLALPSELHRPLGIAIAGGLTFNRLLRLYMRPVLYLVLDRVRVWDALLRQQPKR